MQAFLRIKAGVVGGTAGTSASAAGAEKIVKLRTQPLTIGRHADNTLVIDDSQASRFHCVIEREVGGTFILRDLQSRNGTLLNGQRVMHQTLKTGDLIVIGAVQMQVVIRAEANAAGTPSKNPEQQLDVLEVIEEPPAPAGDAPSTIRALHKAADALLEKGFGADAIQLINTRGRLLHEAAAKGAAKAPPGPSEIEILLRAVLLICFRSHATDIHLEPRVDDFLLRIRMDGNLLDIAPMNKDVGTRLTALIKILCELDTTQKSIVQEGHFASSSPAVGKAIGTEKAGMRRVDYRVSFVPTLHGQKMVVRVFDTAHGPAVLEDLQLPAAVAASIGEELNRDMGLILVCGPTGSGKTTTLYSLLRSCGASFRNIVTIEDPIEVQLEGTTQLPVDEANGKGFAALLRSVLRQDPDVIMVGEIRDPETAKIALQAAMTGHLVLSTIHTRDTAGTIFRLLDLGTEPYMVAQGLHLVLAQRLVRTLCTACKRAVPVNAEDRRRMGRAGEAVRQIYAPVGCPKCLGTGFYSRRAFFEFLSTNDPLRELILKKPSQGEIQATLGEDFVRLLESGYDLVAGGLTSIDEVERAVGK